MSILETRLYLRIVELWRGGRTRGAPHVRGHSGIVGRFAARIAVAMWATTSLGGMTEIRLGRQQDQVWQPGPMIAVRGIVLALYLISFKDGIDGIAAAQAVFMAGAGSVPEC